VEPRKEEEGEEVNLEARISDKMLYALGNSDIPQ
jgi:hypothetical protein